MPRLSTVAKMQVKGYNAVRLAPQNSGDSMKKTALFFVLGLSVLWSAQAAAQTAAAASQSVKVGYVNVARIESESAMAQQSIEQLKKEFANREKQLQDLQNQGNEMQADLEKNGATMPIAERQAKEKRMGAALQQYQQMARSLLEELEARKRENFAVFLAEVNTIIKGIAEAGKYDLIIQQAVFNSPQTDITDQVMKEIAKRPGVVK